MRSGGALSATTVVWLMLLAASAAWLWLGAAASVPAGRGGTVAIVGVLALAFAKIWLIVRYFMEVRFAPRWLRLVLDAWIVGVFIAVTSLYLMAGSR